MMQVVPKPVLDAIRRHILATCKDAEAGFLSADDEEDTLTGAWCGKMETARERRLRIDDGRWSWRISYKKFRSRSSRSVEVVLGADGIVQVVVEDRTTGEVLQKGLLFQAKTERNRNVQELRDQVGKMSGLVGDGCCVVSYTSEGYFGVPGEAFRADGSVAGLLGRGGERLGTFLGDRFLGCTVGSVNLYYDYSTRTLFVPSRAGGYRRYKARLKHRLTVRVVNSPATGRQARR